MMIIRFTLAMFLSLFCTLLTYAQDFKEVLKTTLNEFATAKDPQARITASNRLELISAKFADQWAAPYYTAYSKVMLSFFETNGTKKDQLLDQADKYLEQAKKLAPDNDEIYVVAALSASSRIGVDPQNRWQEYGAIYDANIQRAKKLRDDNPRIYYLQGLNTLYTPEMYGGGKKAALPYFEKADTLFSKEKEDNIEKPFWGKADNAHNLAQCREAVSAKQ